MPRAQGSAARSASAPRASTAISAGPSFNELRVTAHQSLLAITGVWDGHSKVMTLMTRAEVKLVSDYLQAATKDHKYKATLPSDAFR